LFWANRLKRKLGLRNSRDYIKYVFGTVIAKGKLLTSLYGEVFSTASGFLKINLFFDI
jgi:hypothetical protein